MVRFMKRKFLLITVLLLIATRLSGTPVLINTTTATLVTKDENVVVSLKVSNVATPPDQIIVKYSKGVPDSWKGPYAMNYISGTSYEYNYTITSPQIPPKLYYYFIVQIDGQNYYCTNNGVVADSDNPFSVSVFEIDSVIPHIIHQPDYVDDEDDGSAGKFQGIAGNGVPDEDEDSLDSDPYQFQDGFTEDDTGNPWGITTVTIKNNPITIKAIFEETEGAAQFDADAEAYLFYKRSSETEYKKLKMGLIQGKVFAVDIPYYEVKEDIEYFIVAIDPSGVDPKTGTGFLNIAINDANSFMYSGDGKDNDGDGRTDEESYNDIDDDGDNRIDEDLNSASPILIKAEGKDINKQIVITNIKNNITIVNETQIDYEILSLPIKPYRIRVYNTTDDVPDFSSWVSTAGTVKQNLQGETVEYGKVFPDGTDIVVKPNTFDSDVKIVLSIPDILPSLPSGSKVKFTGFYRKIEVFDRYGNKISYFNKPLVITFHRSLLSSVKDTLIVYYYNGVKWIPIGGERSELDKSQQIGYGNPMVITTSTPGIFAIVENPDEWGNAEPGNVSSLETDPAVFTPNNDGVADTTIIKFLLASNDDPRAIGDVPLYCPALLSIEIIDLAGNIVRKLCEDYEIRFEWRYGTTIHYEWDGKDDFGNLVQPGVYIVQITVKNISEWLSQDKDKIFKKSCAVVVVR